MNWNSEYKVGENGVEDIEILDKNYPCVKVTYKDGHTLEVSGDYKVHEAPVDINESLKMFEDLNF